MSLWRNKFVLLLQNTSYETTALSIVTIQCANITRAFLQTEQITRKHFKYGESEHPTCRYLGMNIAQEDQEILIDQNPPSTT